MPYCQTLFNQAPFGKGLFKAEPPKITKQLTSRFPVLPFHGNGERQPWESYRECVAKRVLLKSLS